MRRTLLFIFFIICINSHAQFSIGLSDTYYACTRYEVKGYFLSLEHSLYSETIDNQKIRVSIGYENNWNWFQLNLSPYFSSLWNGRYQDIGSTIKSDFRVLPKWHMDATINPHYDTELGYKTCYSIGALVSLIDQLSVIMHYSNIPEFREPEKRARIGAAFKVANLYVQPELSIPLEGQQKSSRVLCSFNYTFHSTK